VLLRSLAGLAAAAAVVLVCAGAAEAAGGHDGGGHGGALHVNWWTWDEHAPPVGWFIVDFVIFVALLVHFARKPIARAFAQRHESIRRSLRDAEQAHAAAQSAYDVIRGKLGNADSAAAEVLASGRRDGEADRDRIVQAAGDYAERLRKDSGSVAAQEEDQARQRLRGVAIVESLGRAQQWLRTELSDADRSRLLEEALTELEKGPRASSNGSAPALRRAAGGGAA
jgi:ATP synthase F0 subunit b